MLLNNSSPSLPLQIPTIQLLHFFNNYLIWFDINFKSKEHCHIMSQLQISQIWNEINQILELESGRFSIEELCTRDWYLQVLEIIFPDLNDQLAKIADIQSEEAAIDRMLLLMAQEEIIEEDFLEIKGANIAKGHKESIFYVIQLFMALVEKALEDAEEEGEAEEEEVEVEAEEYDEEFDESRDKLAQKKQEFKEEMLKFQNAQKNKERQYSDKKNQRECHSVLGIGNQFEPEQNEEEEDEQEEEQFHHNNNFEKEHNEETFKNVFPQQNYQSQKNDQKMLKQPSNMYQNNEEEDIDQNYLKQKLQKHKSEEQFKNIPKKKSPKESKVHEAQKIRKLVSHPQIPKNYPKAATEEQKKLTKDVKKVIKASRKKNEHQTSSALQKVTSADHLQKKRRQLNHYVSNTKKPMKNDDRHRKTEVLKQKNQQKLKKLLKWKQANLKRQKQELEQDMEMKVQLKKELYIKKINKLIINLEKNRMIEKKREERQREKKEKEAANKRLQAIEQQYKIQLKLLQEKSEEKLGKKTFVNTDHKQIIEGLERELKKQNEKQLINLKMKFRREEAQLEDDLEKLQNEIIKTYKRN